MISNKVDIFSGLDIFSGYEKTAVEKFINYDTEKIKCQIRNKEIKLNPEEKVRQLYIYKLMNTYGYKPSNIKIEVGVNFGRETKRADIIVYDDDETPYIVIEVKKSSEKDGKEQLRSYTNGTGSPIAVWTNGKQIEFWHRRDPNYFENIKGIPNSNETFTDYLNQPFTLLDLMIKDKLLKQNSSLKKIIKDMENEVLANAGVNVFEEGFKLIFIKLFDEMKIIQSDKNTILSHANFKGDETYLERIEKLKKLCENKNVYNGLKKLIFYNYGSDNELKENINELFLEAQEKWKNIFPEGSRIELSPSHLAICVASLQEVKLFNSNLEVIDEAFEYLINKDSKGEKGQYFTIRYVIDMCVKMLNPHKNESMIDTAAGSCGFPVHTWFSMIGHLFDGKESTEEEKKCVKRIFGIDFDERAVRVARTINLIAGDGETNVLHLNTLDYDKNRWNEINDTEYRSAFKNLLKYAKKKDDYKEFNFDILLANPPFAGDIKEGRILTKYEIAKDSKGKTQKNVGRDILFIERNLDFVRDGGRLALVLPQGRFNNSSDANIREFIGERARILAVVGLHGNTFKPHTGTKTSVIFLQKWSHLKELTTEEIKEQNIDLKYYCPKVDDYDIFFAVSEKSGKDNSGEYVYVKNENGEEKLDKLGHKIKDHDLHDHDGGINPKALRRLLLIMRKSNVLVLQNRKVNMRITEYQKEQIKNNVHHVFGDNSKVYLFGSRVDDNKRGGDIDLFIECEERYNNIKNILAFSVKLQEKIGEQKIDIVVKSFGIVDDRTYCKRSTNKGNFIMNRDSILIEKIKETIKECDIHISRINSAFEKINSYFPFTENIYNCLSSDDIQALDQFIYRYTKLQDKIGTSLLKNICDLIEYVNDSRTFIDILNILEKRHIIKSMSKWKSLRSLRNRLTHEYTDNIGLQVEILNEVYNSYFYIKEEYLNIKNYIRIQTGI